MLVQTIQADLLSAMKSKNTIKLDVLRDLKTRITNEEKKKGIEITDENILNLMKTMLKQRADSYEQFTAAGRLTLAKKEQTEIEIIQAYLPKKISGEALKSVIYTITAYLREEKEMNLGFIMKRLSCLAAGEKGNKFSFDGKEASEFIKERVKHGISDLSCRVDN
jgi:uncharacterized protein YqeY